uniref:Uncharacterized protein n=1 Tax=Homalodisca liturata TaxID=320908 RepID=A0A1B6K8Y3_9HEMI
MSLMPMMLAITKRHDAIREHLLDIRLDKRVPFQELFQHLQVPEEVLPTGPRDDRPDQQDLVHNRRDVPYDTAKEKKLEKYASVARLVLTGGYRTSVNAFVVGSLGAWDYAN